MFSPLHWPCLHPTLTIFHHTYPPNLPPFLFLMPFMLIFSPLNLALTAYSMCALLNVTRDLLLTSQHGLSFLSSFNITAQPQFYTLDHPFLLQNPRPLRPLQLLANCQHFLEFLISFPKIHHCFVLSSITYILVHIQIYDCLLS